MELKKNEETNTKDEETDTKDQEAKPKKEYPTTPYSFTNDPIEYMDNGDDGKALTKSLEKASALDWSQRTQQDIVKFEQSVKIWREMDDLKKDFDKLEDANMGPVIYRYQAESSFVTLDRKGLSKEDAKTRNKLYYREVSETNYMGLCPYFSVLSYMPF